MYYRGYILTGFRFTVFIAIVLAIACVGIGFADTGVPAVPEIQGITTGTSSNVIGTVTESDSGAWTTTNNPPSPALVSLTLPPTGRGTEIFYSEIDQLEAAGGSVSGPADSYGQGVDATSISIPTSLLNTDLIDFPGMTWGDYIDTFLVPFSGYIETDTPAVDQ